ncbi:MAG: hypothetical protein AVDCRST_MAG13-3787, partial [uncultured Solirubrobacteraceae bacterium]
GRPTARRRDREPRARGDLRDASRPAPRARVELRRFHVGEHRPGHRDVGVPRRRGDGALRGRRARHRRHGHRQRDRRRADDPRERRELGPLRPRAVHVPALGLRAAGHRGDRPHRHPRHRDGLDRGARRDVRPRHRPGVQRGPRHEHRAQRDPRDALRPRGPGGRLVRPGPRAGDDPLLQPHRGAGPGRGGRRDARPHLQRAVLVGDRRRPAARAVRRRRPELHDRRGVQPRRGLLVVARHGQPRAADHHAAGRAVAEHDRALRGHDRRPGRRAVRGADARGRRPDRVDDPARRDRARDHRARLRRLREHHEHVEHRLLDVPGPAPGGRAAAPAPALGGPDRRLLPPAGGHRLLPGRPLRQLPEVRHVGVGGARVHLRRRGGRLLPPAPPAHRPAGGLRRPRPVRLLGPRQPGRGGGVRPRVRRLRRAVQPPDAAGQLAVRAHQRLRARVPRRAGRPRRGHPPDRHARGARGLRGARAARRRGARGRPPRGGGAL